MAQDDNQNRDRQTNPQDREGTEWQGQSQGGRESTQDQVSGSRPDASPELDEVDEEERDDDSRTDGSPNRRNSIG